MIRGYNYTIFMLFVSRILDLFNWHYMHVTCMCMHVCTFFRKVDPNPALVVLPPWRYFSTNAPLGALVLLVASDVVCMRVWLSPCS